MMKTFDFHIIIGPNPSANIRPLHAVCRMAPSYTKFSENDVLVYGHVKSGFWVDWHQCALADGTGNPWYSVCLLRIAGRVQDTITSWLRQSRSHLLSDRVFFTKPDCMIREMNNHATSGIIHTESKSSNISHLVLHFLCPIHWGQVLSRACVVGAVQNPKMPFEVAYSLSSFQIRE